ncbi:hypothetical protein O7599_27510 [Streptomyces sp. WMMC500]|nr:hypothetical protein [Streptomyces sp. WMMC500]WBB59297.1 hypothetical protein O7599_27510 [Streptomyces sp. WMMC500]
MPVPPLRRAVTVSADEKPEIRGLGEAPDWRGYPPGRKKEKE